MCLFCSATTPIRVPLPQGVLKTLLEGAPSAQITLTSYCGICMTVSPEMLEFAAAICLRNS
jgi:hypothetical protein